MADQANQNPSFNAVKREPTPQERTYTLALSVLFILLGVGFIAFLFYWIFSNNSFEAARTGETGEDPVLIFLDNFGIIVPVLVVGLSMIFMYLGYRITSQHITPAKWAQVALTWLIIFSVVVGVILFVTASVEKEVEGQTQEVWDLGTAIVRVIPLIIAIAIFYIGLRWLNSVISFIFHGEESLASADARTAWNLLIPTVAVLILIAARPLEETFITSLTDKRFGSGQTVNFVGLDNYAQLFAIRLDTVGCRTDDETGDCDLNASGEKQWELINREALQNGYRTAFHFGFGDQALAISGKDDDFISAFWNTVQFTIISVTLELILGLFVAMVVNSKFSGRGILRTAMLVPWAIPTVVSARLWETMLRDNQSGIINKVAVDLGIIDSSQAWLSNSAFQINALVAIDVWKTTPFMALLLLAGLQTISKDIYEAADVDGASKVRQFFSITLPLLRPTIAVALVFRTLDSLRIFDLFQVLLGRLKLTMASYNYETLIQNQDGGYASAIGVVIFILIFIFTVIYVQTLGVETE